MKKTMISGVVAAITALMLMGQAFAMEVPIEQTTHEVNGQQTITQVFEVAVGTDPETLIMDDFEQDGFMYELNSIVKGTDTETTKKHVTQTMQLTLTAKQESLAREEAIKYMRPSIEYDDGTFSGVLYVNPGTLTLEPINQHTVYGTRSVTKQFTSEYNDDAEIPQSVTDGGYTYSLSGFNWAEGDMGEDGMMPENYVATATYKRTVSSQTNDGYTATVEYSGEVGHTAPETVLYTVTYFGYPIVVQEPSSWDRLVNGAQPRSVVMKPGTFVVDETQPSESAITPVIKQGIDWNAVLRVVIIVAASAVAVLAALVALKHYISTTVTVFARDEHSGEDHVIQRLHIRKKKPVINVKYLKAPESKHFIVSIKRKFAANLLGKQLTIQVGKKVIEHPVTQCYGDIYQIPIEID